MNALTGVFRPLSKRISECKRLAFALQSNREAILVSFLLFCSAISILIMLLGDCRIICACARLQHVRCVCCCRQPKCLSILRLLRKSVSTINLFFLSCGVNMMLVIWVIISGELVRCTLAACKVRFFNAFSSPQCFLSYSSSRSGQIVICASGIQYENEVHEEALSLVNKLNTETNKTSIQEFFIGLTLPQAVTGNADDVCPTCGEPLSVIHRSEWQNVSHNELLHVCLVPSLC